MASTENGASPRLSLAIGDLVLLGEVDELRPAGQVPFPPGRDDLDIRVERIGRQFKPYLVVALASGAMGDRVGAGFGRDFDKAFGNQRPRDRRAQEVKTFIDGICPEHREDEIAHELFADIFDKDVLGLDAQKFGLLTCGLQFFALAQIGGKSDHFAAIFGLQPFQDDRRI